MINSAFLFPGQGAQQPGMGAPWRCDPAWLLVEESSDRTDILLRTDRAGVPAESVDALIVATTSPDRQIPATAALVHERLGIGGGCYDLNAACAGFVYALVNAYALIEAGARHVVVIGAETMTRLIDPDDRTTAALFGDGAGAVVVAGRPGVRQMRGWDSGSDGRGHDLLTAEHGGYLQMDGPEVFRQAVRLGVHGTEQTLKRADESIDDVDLFIPHQANARITEAIVSRLGVDTDRVASVLSHTGNTSAASVPMALADSLDRGRIADDDLVVLVGFGAGMSWAGAALRWRDEGGRA